MKGESFSTAVRSNTIDIRLAKLDQLFNSFDPSPFRERDLDTDAEEHIVSWARELEAGPIGLVIHLPAHEIARADAVDLKSALANYFTDRADQLDRERRELFRLGRRYLAVGLPILILCLIASHRAEAWIGAGTFSRIVQESLIIVGWVANWKPLETFLYDWWPLRRRADLYRRIAVAQIGMEVAPSSAV
jgi:hypothetical protein